MRVNWFQVSFGLVVTADEETEKDEHTHVCILKPFFASRLFAQQN